MFKSKIMIFPLLCLCCLVSIGCMCGNEYNLTDQSGEVLINSLQPGSGDEVKTGDTVASGINAFAVLSGDDNRIFLFPESKVTVEDTGKRAYSVSEGEAVFVNSDSGVIEIKKGSAKLKMDSDSTLSVLKAGDYFEICTIGDEAWYITGDKKKSLQPGARTVIYDDRIISSRPLSVLEVNRLKLIQGITKASELTPFFIKRKNLPDSKLVKLYMDNGSLKVIKTRTGRVFIGSMTVRGSSVVIKTDSGEVKLKTSEISSVQNYDKL